MSFRLIFELEPPRVPDLGKVGRQIDIFGPVVDTILVPDNHLGLPAMSSVAVAIEISKRGFNAMAAINARDRNELRLESDLITLQAYGVNEVLFLFGDRIVEGRGSLSVRRMLEMDCGGGLRRGALAGIGKPLGWRKKADFLLTKLDFGPGAAAAVGESAPARVAGRGNEAGYWREAVGFRQPIYCGVLALPDLAMARKILNNIPDLTLPDGYLAGFEEDPEFGFRTAIDELDELCDSGIDGAQLVVPANRRRFVELLQDWKVKRGIA